MRNTEMMLLNWRYGSTIAERLSADLLVIEGYSSVDPQCPLGGRDGTKDILCERNGWKYVGASYFAIEQKSFSIIKNKFKGDLEGVKKNGADGIIFITNQKISPKERDELLEISLESSSKAIIYHKEQIRVILDSPLGFALRLEYLQISMSQEEQLSFFSSWHNVFDGLLNNQSEHIIQSISKKIDTQMLRDKNIMEELITDVVETTCNALNVVMKSRKTSVSFDKNVFINIDKWDINTIQMLHASLMFEQISINGGFRKSKVWIGKSSSKIEDASYIPPEPEEVHSLMSELMQWWQDSFSTIINSNDEEKILLLTKFHSRFLSIHPFLDGNGRMARFILQAQSQALFNITHAVKISQSTMYFQSLDDAKKGDFTKLNSYLTQVILGI